MAAVRNAARRVETLIPDGINDSNQNGLGGGSGNAELERIQSDGSGDQT